MALTLADLMRGREGLKKEELSEQGGGGMANVAKAIEQSFQANPQVTKVASSVTDTTTTAKFEQALLKEQKKTNSLLGELIQTEKKYFEENKELIDRLLGAQEQMLERKSGSTVDTIAKATTPVTDKDGKKISGGDLAGAGVGIGALLGILGAALPEIVKQLKENFPELFKKLDSFINTAEGMAKKFTDQPAEKRDLERMGLTVGGAAAKQLAERGIEKMTAEQAAKEAETAAAKSLYRNTEKEVGVESKKVAAEAAAKRAMFDEEKKVYTSQSGKKLTENAKGRVVEEGKGNKFASAAEAQEFKEAKTTMNAAAPTIEEALAKKVGPEAAADVMKAGKGGAKQFIAENLSKAKGAAKIGAAKLAKGMIAKSIPLVGAVIGAIDAGYRISQGDYYGAAISGVSGVLSNPFASMAGMMALLAHDIYRDVYKTDYEDDVRKDSEAANEKMKELGPIVYEALSQELKDSMNDFDTPDNHPDEEAVYTPEGQVLYYQPKTSKSTTSTSTGKVSAPGMAQARRAENAAAKPQGMAQARMAERNTEVSPVTSSSPRIEGGTSGGQVIYNDNKTINNVENGNAGGGGSATGFPNTSTAPQNPWDGALYGD